MKLKFLYLLPCLVLFTFLQSPAQKPYNKAEFVKNLYWWDSGIKKKPYSWYRTEPGLTMAQNILSWQDNGTGWPLMGTSHQPFEGDSTLAGPWGMKAAIVKASLNEMRFLTRGFIATQDSAYLTSLLGGLDYILDAQYETGGWPRAYPDMTKTDYYRYVSFNDDVVSDMLYFLQEIQTEKDYRVIGEDNLERAKDAYNRGIDFILKSQIMVNGKRTAWPQQCDPDTYEPKSARAFEPASISGGESANVLLFLMDIKKPSPEVKGAIEAGVQWYRDSQINGLELIKTKEDVMVQPNNSAPPLWARYYEIETNTPIFAGRDGIIKYNLAEIEQERRRGYQWYNNNGTKVFERYEEWLYERKWDDQPTTNVDQSKVTPYTLPDPLILENGKKVKSVKTWESKRRSEILSLFEQNQHGVIPSDSINIQYDVLELEGEGMNGKSKRTQVNLTFPDHPDKYPIRVLIHTPANEDKPVPTLLHISFTPNSLLFDEPGIQEDSVWNKKFDARIPDKEALLLRDIKPEKFIESGFGVVTVYYGDIEPDYNHGGKLGVRPLFGVNDPRKDNEWGAIGAWSWGLSRVMDYLQSFEGIEGSKIALSGVSRLGKTAIWTGARDERFAMVIPMLSGEGGAAISRRNYGETIADLTKPSRYHYWYAPKYSDYAFDVDKLPLDGHMLLSLIAPRPVLQIVGSTDTWSDPKGEWEAAKAAEPVYELFKKETLTQDEFPEPGKPILKDMGFFMHDGKHTVLDEDFEVMIQFMDLHFR